MGTRRNILLDCDPGIDDAIALCLAAAHPEAFRLLGITTVAGNQTIEKVTENALRLSEFLGLHAPVARGARTPVIREPLTASGIHGKNGLGDVLFPRTVAEPVKESAVLFMRNRIMELPPKEKVTLVAIGPLTNVGLLLKACPEVRERILEIVVMGGASTGGNVTSNAEFNIYEDPEGAAMVFLSGLPLVMCGLDVTEKCGLDREDMELLLHRGGRVSEKIGKMLQFYLDSPGYRSKKAASIHDAVTFMYLLHPEIFQGEKMYVQVDCSRGISRGATVCDRRSGAPGQELPVLVLLDADTEKFREYLLEGIFSLDEKTEL